MKVIISACLRDTRSDVNFRGHIGQALFIGIFHVKKNRRPQGVVDSIKYMMDDITGHL